MAGMDDDARLFAALYLCLLPLFLAPLLMTPFLPGLDLPFHLSMADMLSKRGDPASPYAPWYEARLGVAPYAAHYGALLLLGHVTSLVRAHLIIVMAYVAALPLAMAATLSAMGRSRLPALLGFLLAYNLTLHYGFVSFALSLPVLFALLASLTRLLTAERPSASTAAWAAGWAVLLFLCHLQNFLYGMGAAAAFLLFVWTPWRQRLLGAAAIVPSLACLAWWQMRTRFEGDPLEQKKTLDFAWRQLKGSRLADLGPRTWTDDAWDRLRHIDVHVLRGFVDQVHVRGCDALLAVVAGYVLLGVLGLLLPRPLDAPRSRLGLAGVVAFLGATTAYLALPHHLPSFELMTFYPRFAVLVVALLLLVIPPGLRRFRGVAALVVATPVAYVCAVYGIELVKHYQLFGEEVADVADVMEKTPPGGRAIGVIFNRRSRVMGVESPFVGMAGYYVALHPSPTSFTPLSYCGLRHMPCRYRIGAPALPDAGPWNPAGFHAPTQVPFYDYFFLRSPTINVFGDRGSEVEQLHISGSWVVYRRRPTAPAPSAVPSPPTDAGAEPTDAGSLPDAGPSSAAATTHLNRAP